MNLIVWGIVGGVNDQNSTVKIVCADDWAAESAIKASNVLHFFFLIIYFFYFQTGTWYFVICLFFALFFGSFYFFLSFFSVIASLSNFSYNNYDFWQHPGNGTNGKRNRKHKYPHYSDANICMLQLCQE